MPKTGRRCKYCGEYLDSEYIITIGSCFYCDNPKCPVKPMTDYNFVSSEIFIRELNEISLDKMEI